MYYVVHSFDSSLTCIITALQTQYYTPQQDNIQKQDNIKKIVIAQITHISIQHR